ncbi:MAG: hypothetical protein M3Y33_08600 [Actinomycetota bacterium]|nr:hypothetical protein [Actinomycetota bacterium]
MPDASAADPETPGVITRPNGKPYRPQKVTARMLDGDDDMDSVLVTGTHDEQRALELARQVVAQQIGRGYEPEAAEVGWWRLGMSRGEPCWIADDERGQAGVLFREIVEVEFRA